MDVTLPADRLRIAQPLCDRFHRAQYVLLRLGGRLTGSTCDQQFGRQNGTGPGAEVLRRVLLAGDRAQILVDIRRVDGAADPLVIVVLEQLIAGNVAACLHYACEPAVVEVHLMFDAALPAKDESYSRPTHLHMPIAQCCQPKRMILLCVLVVPDANERLLEQLHGGPQHFFPCEPALPQGARGLPVDCRERAREPEQALVFRFVANAAPIRMVAILFTAARIAANGLKVAPRIVTDPYVPPRRRDDEAADAIERLLIPDTPSMAVQIYKPRPVTPSANTGTIAARISQPGHACSSDRIARVFSGL
jgi:hypothetical protein